MNKLESRILRFIDESTSKITFGTLKNGVGDSVGSHTTDLKYALANLISSGHLCYSFHFGQSFIERSLEKPIQVSEHVVLKPERCSVEKYKDLVVVSIEKGASFGGGDHPTTRMAIQLIDNLLYRSYWQKRKNDLKAIDIGTGSGILSLVAAKIGVGSVVGIDTDPCSIVEARENVVVNQLRDRVFICSESIGMLDGSFDVVIANLRTPSLVAFGDQLQKKVNQKSALIFSGMKTEESTFVYERYRKIGFSLVERRSEKGWCAMCLVRA